MKKIFLTVALAAIAFTGSTFAQGKRGSIKNEVKTEQSSSTFEDSDDDDDMASTQKGSKKDLTPEARAKRRLTKMDEKLTLSPDQENKINTLLIGYFTKKDALKKQFGEDKKSFKKENGGLRRELKSSIESVLTTTQKATWDAIKSEKKEGKGGKEKGKGKKAE
jgi:protein CpxP